MISGNKAMHFVWDNSSFQFLGINSFGIRLRHENFDRWLRERKSLQYVIAHLEEANFDPEFFDHYEREIIDSFSRAFPQLKLETAKV
jgi:hypothetical protein